MSEFLGIFVPIVFWLLVIIAAIALESVTANLVSIWFVFGGIASAICACRLASIKTQIIVFLLVSLLTLICTRPLVSKNIKKTNIPTNVDSIIGQKAKVTDAIDNYRNGEIYVGGKRWSAKSTDGSEIESGTTIVIDKVEGVTAFVTLAPSDTHITPETICEAAETDYSD